MTEASNIHPKIPQGRLPELSLRPRQQPEAYKASDEVRTRAAVTRSNDTIHNRKALQRLDQVLNSGRPLKDEVPRGFYLDLKV